MKPLVAVLAFTWAGLWFTPDQQGARAFGRGDFEAAAGAFGDPMWQGVAWFRAGEFKNAAQAFARRDSAEGHFNRGNALVMLGKYDDAVKAYNRALEKRPGWTEAEENRALAQARAKLLETEGGEMTGGQLEADEIVFDNKAENSDETTEVVGGDELSDEEIQALWLRRVQTRPADFLRSKFAFQHAAGEVDREGGGE